MNAAVEDRSNTRATAIHLNRKSIVYVLYGLYTVPIFAFLMMISHSNIEHSYCTLFLSSFPNTLTGCEVANTHLDFRKKNFDFMYDFFLVFPFTALQMMASSTAKSHFDLDFCDFDAPKRMPSLDFLVTFDDCSCCFFDVVKFCKKLNITLRVIAQPAPLGLNKLNMIL